MEASRCFPEGVAASALHTPLSRVGGWSRCSNSASVGKHAGMLSIRLLLMDHSPVSRIGVEARVR